MALVEPVSYPHSSAIHGPRDTGLLGPILPYSPPYRGNGKIHNPIDQFNLTSELKGIDGLGTLGLHGLDRFDLTLRESWVDVNSAPTDPRSSGPISDSEVDEKSQDFCVASSNPQSRGPFRKWMKSIHRRAAHRPSVRRHHHHPPRSSSDIGDIGHVSCDSRLQRQTSSSGSSFGFVEAVRSASVSLASVSSVNRSRRNTARSTAFSKTDRSSRASASGARISEDSVVAEKPLPRQDAAVTERALRRRRVLEEIITTEESYIGDVRFLINVYITILASLPSQAVGLRSSINRNLTDIVELHEELLGELHRVVPNSEYSHSDNQQSIPLPINQSCPKSYGHRRWRSLNAVPEHDDGSPLVQGVSGLLADPQVAADVARVFGKRMNRFFIYKEYGAKYDMMTADISAAPSSMPDWELYQKGLEALASTVRSAKGNADTLKKALTLSDLLMKPIQRICKYPLLFSELLKYTTVVDSPNAHMEVETTLARLREATAEINRATDDPQVRTTLEKTWLLQDRLVFPQRKLDAVTRTRIRSFGRIQLCGALHVCWQSAVGVEGQYMISLLYQDVLCLASAGKVDPIYTIMACVNLNGIKVEDVDNGRGIQCHTAPFSWKLIFECDCEMYEFLMTACSPKEEEEWRSRLSGRNNANRGPGDTSIFSTTELKMKSLGTVFGKQGTTARKLSINRATTISPKVPLCRVVLKNTSAMRDGQGSSSGSLTIHRSQSLLTANPRLPILAPPRAERVRLENLLADVWSRESLPFPGVSSRPGSGHLVRASSMMLKLSMSNLAGSLNKRSSSLSRRTPRVSEDGVGVPCQRKDSIGPEPDIRPSDLLEDDADTMTALKRPRIQEMAFSPTQDDTDDFVTTGSPETVRRTETRDGPEPPASLDTGQDDSSRARMLRNSSGNSIRFTAPKDGGKGIGDVLEKENACEIQRRKSLGRWAKMGHVAKGDGKGHGLRSFFR